MSGSFLRFRRQETEYRIQNDKSNFDSESTPDECNSFSLPDLIPKHPGWDASL
jgi:hypothetical protein